MLFLASNTEPTIVMLLTEADLQKLRSGHSLFVDDRATKGMKFQKAILGYAKTDVEALKMANLAGSALVTHEKKPDEVQCAGCEGLMSAHELLDGKCIVCWAKQAKSLLARSN